MLGFNKKSLAFASFLPILQDNVIFHFSYLNEAFQICKIKHSKYQLLHSLSYNGYIPTKEIPVSESFSCSKGNYSKIVSGLQQLLSSYDLEQLFKHNRDQQPEGTCVIKDDVAELKIFPNRFYIFSYINFMPHDIKAEEKIKCFTKDIFLLFNQIMQTSYHE